MPDPRLKGPFVFLDDSQTPAPRFYHKPREIIMADHPDQLETAFVRLKQAHESGAYLVGHISYELGLTFEAKLAGLLPKTYEHPLLCFGVFERYSEDIPAALLYSAEVPDLQLTPEWSQADYLKRFARVKTYLEKGDCYQINLTFPMRGVYKGDPVKLYAGLRHRQTAKYGGFVRLGGADLLSLSPELFFKKDGQDISMRPMKGTLKRDPDHAKDAALRGGMVSDSKLRAENLMIVDLLRNDLSRLSKPGSVKVPELFSLETYPTLHQMTSRVSGQLKPGTTFRAVFENMFPSGSITGAPKIRAMEIIHELETGPRGPYCGALGFIDPDGQACFNVGIRTLSLKDNKATYHVGGGLIMDSRGPDEYAECLLKANVLRAPEPYFIETFYSSAKTGPRNIGAHLSRLSRALGNDVVMQNIIEKLARHKPIHDPAHMRLTARKDGHITLADTPYISLKSPVKLALSKYSLTQARQNVETKISARGFYDGERARLKSLYDIDEVIFTNAAGELCEGSFTSLFIEKNGALFTPHIKCGLLPGILREQMLKRSETSEAILTVDDLKTASAIYVGNSMRGLMRAKIIAHGV